MPGEFASSAHQLLDAAYDGLDLESGALIQTSEFPVGDITRDEWRDRGEWLLLGYRMGAENLLCGRGSCRALLGRLVYLCVPETSSTSCDQAVFVDQATGMSPSPDAVLVEVDRFG